MRNQREFRFFLIAEVINNSTGVKVSFAVKPVEIFYSVIKRHRITKRNVSLCILCDQ